MHVTLNKGAEEKEEEEASQTTTKAAGDLREDISAFMSSREKKRSGKSFVHPKNLTFNFG